MHLDQRIAWRSTSGVANADVVTFHRVDDNRTRVMLQMDYEPETLVEKLGDAVGAVKFTARGNLKKFKATGRAARHGNRRLARKRPGALRLATSRLAVARGPAGRAVQASAAAAGEAGSSRLPSG